jgi:RNA polymerase sigma-70 factor (ECF subfamily)
VEDQERLLANWLIDPQPTPEEVVEAMEIEESLMKAIKILPAKQKAAVIMRYFLEMNENEMSDHMEMPLSSIKWWLRTARKKLAELLKP